MQWKWLLDTKGQVISRLQFPGVLEEQAVTVHPVSLGKPQVSAWGSNPEPIPVIGPESPLLVQSRMSPPPWFGLCYLWDSTSVFHSLSQLPKPWAVPTLCPWNILSFYLYYITSSAVELAESSVQWGCAPASWSRISSICYEWLSKTSKFNLFL